MLFIPILNILKFLNLVNKYRGVKISNARVWAGWDKGIYINSGGSPAKRAKAGGQKGRGFRGRNFCQPANFGRVPAAPQARQPVSSAQNRLGFGCINAPVSNFREFCLPFRRRFAPPCTEILARRAKRGSPKRGSYPLRFFKYLLCIIKNN